MYVANTGIWQAEARNNVTFNTTSVFLLLARYVPNVAKEELWDQCKK